MYQIVSRKRARDLSILAALLIAFFALLRFPADASAAATDGVSLCLNVIIPSLFPFFVLSSLMVELGFAEKLGRVFEPVMRPLFNVSGSCAAAFALGFVGGYPVGARTAISLYRSGGITKAEAERLLSFCNNSGPAFILGVVGAGVFSSSRVGLLLYLAHILASAAVGLVFRGWGSKSAAKCSRGSARLEAVSFPAAFTHSVTASFSSTLNICAFVIFFTVAIKMLFITGVIPLVARGLGSLLAPAGLDAPWSERLLTGFIELTSGVWSLQPAASELPKAAAMAAFMLGWAGISIHCQVLSFIAGSGLSVRSYILGKLLHGSLSALFASLLLRLFRVSAPAASYLAQQVAAISAMRFSASLAASSGIAALLLVIFFAVYLSRCKRKYGKAKKNSV